MVSVEEKSNDTQEPVDDETRVVKDIGAGSQGHMFGYATDETPELMPLSHSLATRLGKRLTEVRKDGTVPFLLPDGKTQVVVEYKNHGLRAALGAMEPVRVHTVLVSSQHTSDVEKDTVTREIQKKVIDKVVPAHLTDNDTIFLINPSGTVPAGGLNGDTGLTGRKTMADTYGGWGAHGGGTFSGKDCTKIDRSAAYAARWAAKSLVNAKFCQRCLVQLTYSLGKASPQSMLVDSYGTNAQDVTDGDLLDIVRQNFDFRLGCIMRDLKLRNPIFRETACHSHFGREEPDFLWEHPKDLSHEWEKIKLRRQLKEKAKEVLEEAAEDFGDKHKGRLLDKLESKIEDKIEDKVDEIM
eukprot:Selendium_serpulae@DN4992_c0_g1_i1.p1